PGLCGHSGGLGQAVPGLGALADLADQFVIDEALEHAARGRPARSDRLVEPGALQALRAALGREGVEDGPATVLVAVLDRHATADDAHPRRDLRVVTDGVEQ